MQIKKPDITSQSFRALLRVLTELSVRNRAIVLSVLLAVYSLAIYFLGAYWAFEPRNKDLLDLPPKTGKHSYNPLVSRPERLEIGISQADMIKIQKARDRALADGVLISSKDSYVPARIRQGKQAVNSKLRLKGDWTEHLLGKKWSYRISIKDGNTVFGMREFSIQDPSQRNYIYGWLFQNIIKSEDLIGLRVQLVDVVLNDKDLGVYYLEEHFDKMLIEHNRLREGPIIKFEEDLLWQERARQTGPLEPDTAFYSSAIGAFRAKQMLKDPDKRAQFLKAQDLLVGFRRGELAVKDAFAVDKMARYYALSDLLGGYHMAFFHNLRFYFNPLTSLLEPIAFDADAGNFISGLLYDKRYEDNAYYAFDRSLFSDEEFAAAYFSELERVSRPGFLENKLRLLEPELKKALNILYKDDPQFHFITVNLQYDRQVIADRLNPVKGVHSYLRSMGGSLSLRAANIQSLPLEVLGVVYNNVRVYRPQKKTRLAGKPPKEKVTYVNIDLVKEREITLTDKQWREARLQCRIPGTQQILSYEIFDWPLYEQDVARLQRALQPSELSKISFLAVNDEQYLIYLRPGHWKVTEDLVLPKGYTVVAGGGTILDLSNEASVISYSPLKLIGTEEEAVRFVSSDRTGGGVMVINAPERSLLEHVDFEGLAAPQKEGMNVTGAVTFYESPVDIYRSQFTANRRGDDLLNIVRSPFGIYETRFSKSIADAVDVDFSNGTLQDVSFFKCGNDALDVSGSSIKVRDMRVEHALDKAVSAGEASRVEIDGITVKNSNLGLVSKDSSSLEANGVDLNNCRVGLAAFQKKAEFGPARLKVISIKHQDVKTLAAQQPGSKIILPRTE